MSSPRVERILRKISNFLIYTFFEFVIIIWLYIIGLLAFLCSEFARFFNLSLPCWLCTRIDHIFVPRNYDFYYNKSVCEAHKKDISSLAYCQVHSKLSDIKSMCDRCLLSFATERDSDTHTYKFLLRKDTYAYVEEDHKILSGSGFVTAEKDSVNIRCSCCAEPLTRNSKKSDKPPSTRATALSNASTALSNASISSPRPPTSELKNEEVPSVGLPRISNIKMHSEPQQDEIEIGSSREKSNEDVKDAAVTPILADCEDLSEHTPSFNKENRFFKISLTDTGSASSSPRFAIPSSPRYANRQARKIQIEKELLADTMDKSAANGAEGEALDQMKKEIRLDRKSLVDLYMELDEERSASAEAANNAMAMITRLQAEKAAMQMETLHYQRMINEQAEYEQEALKVMQDQVKVLEADLEAYREKFGPLDKEDLEEYDIDMDEVYNDYKSEFDNDENYYLPTPY